MLGFADTRLAELAGVAVEDVKLAAAPRSMCSRCIKRIDTCAAEIPLPHALYVFQPMRATASGSPNARPMSSAAKKVIILGGGPNRIGQGIEFDYCCVHAAYAMADTGFESIMVNCNPETVSTDYDTSDRLYFEPLTAEDVIALARTSSCRKARSWAPSSSSAARRP